MGGSIRHALFIYELLYMKGDNMEKFRKMKKFLVVFIGIMVLMIGSLCTFAKTNAQVYSEARLKAMEKTGLSSSEFVRAYPYVFCSFATNGKSYFNFSNVGMFYNDVNSIRDGISCVAITAASGKEKLISLSFDGSSWADAGGGSGYGEIWRYALDPKGVNYSNFNMHYKTSDTVFCKSDTSSFFPAPPIAETAGDLPKVVGEKVKVILPVAVCCLALLTFSTILLKRLPRFLG